MAWFNSETNANNVFNLPTYNFDFTIANKQAQGRTLGILESDNTGCFKQNVLTTQNGKNIAGNVSNIKTPSVRAIAYRGGNCAASSNNYALSPNTAYSSEKNAPHPLESRVANINSIKADLTPLRDGCALRLYSNEICKKMPAATRDQKATAIKI